MKTRSRQQESKSKPRTVAFIFLCVSLFFGLLFLHFYPVMRTPIIPNVCPIDGQPAEWSTRQGQRDCEYGHFSTVEKQPHTWLAACP